MLARYGAAGNLFQLNDPTHQVYACTGGQLSVHLGIVDHSLRRVVSKKCEGVPAGGFRLWGCRPAADVPLAGVRPRAVALGAAYKAPTVRSPPLWL